MKRDKIISVRVNSDLLDKVQKIIDSRTYTLEIRGRNHYRYKSENRTEYEKYTIADLLESAMWEYVEKFSSEKKVIHFRYRKCITIHPAAPDECIISFGCC